MSRRHNIILFLALSVLIVLNRLSYINLGFGLDSDAWRVQESALAIQNGHYLVSRFPGYPVWEALHALLPVGNYAFHNSLSLFFLLIALAAFARLLLRVTNHPLLIGLSLLCFAFNPQILQHSMNSMDYVPSLACWLLALNLALSQRLWLSLVPALLMVGIRPANYVLLFPLFILFKERKAMKQFLFASHLALLLMYFPIFLQYGKDMFVASPYKHSYVQAYLRDIPALFGWLGSIAIGIGWLFSFKKLNTFSDDSLWYALMLGAGLTILVFLGLPVDTAYMIPAIPFILFTCVKFLPGKTLYVVFALLLVSPFVLHIHSPTELMKTGSGVQMKGEVPRMLAIREKEMAFLNSAVEQIQESDKPVAVYAAYYAPKFRFLLRDTRHTVIEKADAVQLQRLRASGHEIWIINRLIARHQRLFDEDISKLIDVRLLEDVD